MLALARLQHPSLQHMRTGLVNGWFTGVRDGPDAVRDLLHTVRLKHTHAHDGNTQRHAATACCLWDAAGVAMHPADMHTQYNTQSLDNNVKYHAHEVVKTTEGTVRGLYLMLASVHAHSTPDAFYARITRTVPCMHLKASTHTHNPQGPAFVASHLAKEHERMQLQGWRIIASAACSQGEVQLLLF